MTPECPLIASRSRPDRTSRTMRNSPSIPPVTIVLLSRKTTARVQPCDCRNAAGPNPSALGRCRPRFGGRNRPFGQSPSSPSRWAELARGLDQEPLDRRMSRRAAVGLRAGPGQSGSQGLLFRSRPDQGRGQRGRRFETGRHRLPRRELRHCRHDGGHVDNERQPGLVDQRPRGGALGRVQAPIADASASEVEIGGLPSVTAKQAPAQQQGGRSPQTQRSWDIRLEKGAIGPGRRSAEPLRISRTRRASFPPSGRRCRPRARAGP